ncbi:MAG: PSD1 and planctomycete cytochrome C domain-containing protein [Isosphaerales bacterium]
MPRWAVLALLVVMAVAPSSSAGEPAADNDPETFFELKVRPVLAGTCVKCHGADKVSGGLRLDSREAMLKGGESGPAVVPGDPGKSLLIQAVQHEDDSLEMPPGKLLPESIRADLAAWVDAGAKWPESAAAGRTIVARKHWAFEPLIVVSPPEDPTGWAERPVDRFIAAGHRARGLRPAPRADPRILIRRAAFDLIGLPPTAGRVEAFVANDSPDAYAHLVDELLASPHYGERWGRYWLDLARYADTAGDNSDYPIPQAYRYRDYVIDAFNADVPYDRFVHEQLAGDILAVQGPPEDYARRVIATGFIAQAKRFGTHKLEDIHQIIEDTLNTTSQVVLGVSLRCARCHDHKFDPITSRDYYALYGFFASTKYPFAGAEEEPRPSEFVPLSPPGEVKARKEKEPPVPRDLLAYAVREGRPTDVKIQKGGNPRDLGEVVPRGVLMCLDPHPSMAIPKEGSGRLELARWLTTSPASALSARVMVNRIWQHHFSKPIVPTPSDFGLRGTPPTHPELLDWLAREFIASGWSVKAMHRKIMLSKTYQLAAIVDTANDETDTGNAWYWRFDRHVLDAEALRDTLLDLGGSLDRSRPGPHPFPPAKSWHFTAHHQFKAEYSSDHRSVYLMVQRLHPHPYLTIFNGPDTSMSTAVRDRSSVPLQALFLLNSPFVHDQAARFARSLIEQRSDPQARVRLAYLRAYGRPPSAEENDRSIDYLRRYEQTLAAEGVAADRRAVESWSSLVRTLLASNEFIYVE